MRQLRLPGLEVGDDELLERGEGTVEVPHGDRVERVDDVGRELEVEAEVDARRDDAAVCLEGDLGDALAALALEVEAVADGGPGMSLW